MQKTSLIGEPINPNKFLDLVENWDGPRNEYWIAVNALSARVRHNGQILIGPESKTVAEIEQIAADLHADLDRVVAMVRERIVKRQSA